MTNKEILKFIEEAIEAKIIYDKPTRAEISAIQDMFDALYSYVEEVEKVEPYNLYNLAEVVAKNRE